MDRAKYKKKDLKLFDNLPSGILINVQNDAGKLEYAYSNPFLAESLGYTHNEFVRLLKKDCFAAIYDVDREKTQRTRDTVALGNVVDSITRQKRKDGTETWILAHVRPIELDGKKGIMLLFSRIQELIRLQNELTERNREWSDILQSVPIGILVYRVEKEVGTVLSINHFLVELANQAGLQVDSRTRKWNEAELALILNQNVYAFCEEADIPMVSKMLRDTKKKPFADCTFRVRGSIDGNPVYIYATCTSKENDDHSRTYYATYQNVTVSENRRLELIEKQNQLYQMSYFDALTGVKNRNAYNKYAEFCKKNQVFNVGLAFCDINGLKQTNDTLGHYYGDNLIRHFSDILREFFDSEYIYRLSGDEFAVIYPDTRHERFQEKMEALIARAQDEDNIASIGYIWKEKVSNIQRRTTQAEQIMYVEKQRYYEQTSSVNSKHRPRMLSKLLQEFEDGRFIMYLQPKTSIDGSKVIGAEALARKIGEDGNIISPYGFVPQLECEKLIPKLDFFMLEETCKFLEKQHKSGKDDFSVSVNVSRVTIVENDFIESVIRIIGKYEFDHHNLELELTESNETMDEERLAEYLLKLKELDVKISLDDMGNDHSTLNLLTMEGFDWVKLDRSLVVQMNEDKARILVRHIIDTCHDLNLKVIAEGVETDDVRQLLMDMNCDAYQGYLKSKPISLEEFENKFLH